MTDPVVTAISDPVALVRALSALANAPRVTTQEADHQQVFTLLANEVLRSNERFAPCPHRPRGLTVAATPDDFAALLGRLDVAKSAPIYITDAGEVDAILNDARAPATGDDGAAWRDHRIQYRPLLSEPWKAWLATSGKFIDQLATAYFIEERLDDFVKPEGAAMLELAQQFEVARSGKFVSANRIANGSMELAVAEENKPRAQIQVPERVTLGMRVFEGLDAYRFDAWFRYRIQDDRLHFSFKLVNAEAVLRQAVADVRTKLVTLLPEHVTYQVRSMPSAIAPAE
jgi:uncharacterized protein YfdQ (DUF2303 family)